MMHNGNGPGSESQRDNSGNGNAPKKREDGFNRRVEACSERSEVSRDRREYEWSGSRGTEQLSSSLLDERTLERIDRRCDKFERLWRDGGAPELFQFLPEEPLAERQETFAELLRVELLFSGQGRSAMQLVADYQDRYGEFADQIPSIIDAHCATDPPHSAFGKRGWDWKSKAFRLMKKRAGEVDGPLADQSQVLAGSGSSATGSQHWLAQEQEALPRTFGDYRLLAVAGYGGMGVVYEAEQLFTGRRAAVKLVRQDRLEGGSSDRVKEALRRFEQEMRIATGIEHDHWVTVFEVGEVDGRAFYAMQFVDGASLAELVQSGPMEGRRAASYIEPVARAIEAGHQQGILHRDVKPQNILVQRETDRPYLTDFGLAKLLADASSETFTGQGFGSPSYISPEQARDASRVDERSDVYGLGATLYHLLTGRAPFQGSSVTHTIEQVLHREAVDPRELNPQIDRDLETICIRCLQKEPARRYASASELADDLRRYLDDKPIRARPITAWHRAGRWVRRNRVVAALGSGVVSLVFLLMVGSMIASWLTYKAWQRTERSLESESVAKEGLADALVSYVETVSSDPLLAEAEFQPLREALLQDVSDKLEKFAGANSSGPEDRRRAARIWLRIAKVHLDSGSIREVERASEEALANLEQVSFTSRSADDRRLQMEAELLLAEAEWEQGRTNPALQRLARLLKEKVPSRAPEKLIRLQASCLQTSILLAWGRLSDAADTIEEAFKSIDILADSPSVHRDFETSLALARAYELLAEVRMQQFEGAAAIQASQQAVQMWLPSELDLAVSEEDGKQVIDLSKTLLDQLPEDWFQTRFHKSYPPADFFRQRLLLARLVWGIGSSASLVEQVDKVAAEAIAGFNGQQNVVGLSLARMDALSMAFFLRVNVSLHRSLIETSPEEFLRALRSANWEDRRRTSAMAKVRLALTVAAILHSQGKTQEAIDTLEELRQSYESEVGNLGSDHELLMLVASLKIALADLVEYSYPVEGSLQMRNEANNTLRKIIADSQSPRAAELLAESLHSILIQQHRYSAISSSMVEQFASEVKRLHKSFPNSIVLELRAAEFLICTLARREWNKADWQLVDDQLQLLRSLSESRLKFEVERVRLLSTVEIAYAYRRKGKRNEARRYFEQALDLMTEEGPLVNFGEEFVFRKIEVSLNLAAIDLANGRTREAGDFYRKIERWYRIAEENGKFDWSSETQIARRLVAIYLGLKHAADEDLETSTACVHTVLKLIDHVNDTDVSNENLKPLIEKSVIECLRFARAHDLTELELDILAVESLKNGNDDASASNSRIRFLAARLLMKRSLDLIEEFADAFQGEVLDFVDRICSFRNDRHSTGGAWPN